MNNNTKKFSTLHSRYKSAIYFNVEVSEINFFASRMKEDTLGFVRMKC